MNFTQDWFSVNITNWNRWLARFKGKPCRFLEIGSFEGRSTVWLLENVLTHAAASIVCIDPYLPGSDPAIQSETAKKCFLSNTADWKAKVTLVTERSQDALPKLSGLFDFVYVDGSHLSTDVYSDGILSWPLVQPGGLLVFDDYFFDMPVWKGEDWKKTCHGVEKALVEMKGYAVIHKNHQVAVLKHT